VEFPGAARRSFHDISHGDGHGNLYDPSRSTALVSDAHTAEVAYTPYQRPPQAQLITTAVPRGLKSFVVRDATLALKGSADTELLSINWTLPAGFGYVLNELHVNIEQDRAQDWVGMGQYLLSNSTPANKGFDYRMALQFSSYSQNGTTLGVASTRNITTGTLSRTPIVPGREGAFNSMRFANLNTTAAAAGKVNALASFWEYDLEQLQYFAAHMALGTIGR